MVDTGTFDQRRGLQVIEQRTCRSRGVTSRLVLHAPFAPFAEPLRSCVHATIPASHRLSLVRDTHVSFVCFILRIFQAQQWMWEQFRTEVMRLVHEDAGLHGVDVVERFADVLLA